MHFSGTMTQRMDGKGRVSIPADFRRVLEAGDPDYTPEAKKLRMRVVYGDASRRCLEVYPIREFDKILAQVSQLPVGTPDREILEMFYVSGSEVVEVDGDGRTVFAQRFRDHIGLPKDGGDAVFAGALEIFRIWTPEEFEAERQRVLAAARARMVAGGSVRQLLNAVPKE